MSAQSRRLTSESFALAVVLATAAGSIEAYSVITLGAFAGAQTGNVVLGSIEISHAHWSAAARYVWPILAFIAGVLLARTLQTGKVAVLVRRPYRAVLTAELLALFVVGCLPTSTPRVLVSVVVTAAVAAQASTFRTLVDIGYNSAFTTGNLMNALIAAHTAVAARSREQLVHARRVFGVIGCYAVGAVAGALITRWLDRQGIWFAVALLAVALVLFRLRQETPRPDGPD